MPSASLEPSCYEYEHSQTSAPVTFSQQRIIGESYAADVVAKTPKPKGFVPKENAKPAKAALERFMAHYGLNQTEAGEQLDSDQSSINRVLRNKQGLQLAAAIRMSQITGWSLDEIYGMPPRAAQQPAPVEPPPPIPLINDALVEAVVERVLERLRQSPATNEPPSDVQPSRK